MPRNFIILFIILILAFNLSGCTALDTFLNAVDMNDSPQALPKSGGRKVPLPPTIQDLERP
jgi:hypothetical protein